MADQAVKSGGPVGELKVAAKSSPNGQKVRTRAVYEHKMSPADQFALQTVLKTKNALTAVAVKIQEGKGCNPELIKNLLSVQSAAAEILFGQ